MVRLRSNFVCLLILLVGAIALTASDRAQACPLGMSGSAHRSCCDGMDRAVTAPPVVHLLHQCPSVLGFRGRESTGHCCCSQPLHAVQASAREVRPAILDPSALPVWLGPPVAVGRIRPARGPPDTGFADPAARHTYLATLRLRI